MNVNRVEEEGGATMKAWGTGVLALLVVVGGCTHSSMVNPLDLEACLRLNDEVGNRESVLTLADGKEHQTRGLILTPDSTSWFDSHGGKLRTVATTEVVEVAVVKRSGGALEGLRIGLLTGTLVGASLGLVDSNAGAGILAPWGAGQRAALCGSLLGGLGGVVGFPLGGGVGSRDVYRFEAPRSGKP
jgi:hypothetical protein